MKITTAAEADEARKALEEWERNGRFAEMVFSDLEMAVIRWRSSDNSDWRDANDNVDRAGLKSQSSCRACIQWLDAQKPVQNPETIAVGDTVEILSLPLGANYPRAHIGKIGKVDGLTRGPQPYLVRIDGEDALWYNSSNLRLISKGVK